MARGGRRAGAGRRTGAAKPSEPVVSIRLPERLVAEVDAYLKTKGAELADFIMGPRRRRRAGDRRPEGKATICNVRMSNAERDRLREAAQAAGFTSLQDFLYSRITPIVQTENATAASSAEPA